MGAAVGLCHLPEVLPLGQVRVGVGVGVVDHRSGGTPSLRSRSTASSRDSSGSRKRSARRARHGARAGTRGSRTARQQPSRSRAACPPSRRRRGSSARASGRRRCTGSSPAPRSGRDCQALGHRPVLVYGAPPPINPRKFSTIETSAYWPCPVRRRAYSPTIAQHGHRERARGVGGDRPGVRSDVPAPIPSQQVVPCERLHLGPVPTPGR